MSTRGRGGNRRRNLEDGWGGMKGYMDAKIQKLQHQFLNEGTSKTEPKTNIFEGIAVHVNGYTNPGSAEIKRLMQQHGGSFIHYYTRRKVTHIIASNLPNSKISNLHDKKVVGPEWITDSIKSGKLLPYQDYLLYGIKNKFQPGVSAFHQKSTPRSTVEDDSNIENCSVEEVKLPDDDCEEDLSTSARRNVSQAISSEDVNTVNCTNSTENVLISLERHKLTDHSTAETTHCKGLSEEVDDSLTLDKSTFIETSENIDINNITNSDKCPESSKFSDYGQVQDSDDVEKTPKCAKAENILSLTKASPNKKGVMGRAGEPQFLSEFYAHSRLHYLSTWGAELKAFMNTLVERASSDFPARIKLRTLADQEKGKQKKHQVEKLIMHVDMDCFFVTVGLLNRPHLRGKPVAVTHGKNREAQNSSDNQGKTKSSFSEIASCSYEAREAGVKNGMFLGTALELCPGLITIPYDFENYKKVSETLYNTLANYTLDVEAVSCDEVLVDCSELMKSTGSSPDLIASVIREDIKENTNCTASAGMGPNILTARMATRVAKPNGQHWVPVRQIEAFMKDKPVKDLPGVGWQINKRLKKMNILTCADLQLLSVAKLETEFGPKTGRALYKYCRGQDDRQIQTVKQRKSVSAEVNYGMRFVKDEEVFGFLNELSVEVSQRLQKVKCQGQQICLKLKVRRADQPIETVKHMGHGICDNIARTSNLINYTDNAAKIYHECENLLKSLKVVAQDVRGMGIQVSKLKTTSVLTGKGSILAFTTNVPARLVDKDKTLPLTERDEATSISRCHQTFIAQKEPDSAACNDTRGQSSNTNAPNSSFDDANCEPSTSRLYLEQGRDMPQDDEQLSPIIDIIPSTPKGQSLPPLPCFPLSGELTSTPRVLQPVDPDDKKDTTEKSYQAEFSKSDPTYKDEQQHWSSPSSCGTNHNKNQKGHGCVLTQSDHSFSQVDPEILKHLPQDIQNEILAAMSRRKQNVRWNEERNVGWSEGLYVMREQERTDYDDESHTSDTDTDDALSYTLFDHSGKPCLCGVSSLPEVKDLLCEWINASEAPEPDDVERIVRFLHALVASRNLENTSLLLKFLHRKLKRKDTPQWTSCLCNITESIQTCVKSLYGSVLKI